MDLPFVVIDDEIGIHLKRFDQIRKGDVFMVNGKVAVCDEPPHISGDATYDGWLLYDEDGNAWFPEDLDRWEDMQL